MRLIHTCRNSSIAILKANNVVLAEVLAALHLDHHQVDDPGVFKPMPVAGGNVGGLIGGDEEFVFAIDHLGHAADDDPVFAAMMVHLQAEAGAGLDLDALDLVAAAFLEHRVGSPGAMHGTVQLVGIMPARS